ncbi:DUF2892 domain-containing protein [bacterium]|nr:DUF2892 domain-containing protein [bacterium]
MDDHGVQRNVAGVERFLRGLVGASLISWALNGHPLGWMGLWVTTTAILEFCPVRALFGRAPAQ